MSGEIQLIAKASMELDCIEAMISRALQTAKNLDIGIELNIEEVFLTVYPWDIESKLIDSFWFMYIGTKLEDK